MTAPMRPEIRSLALRLPSPKWADRAMPLLTTEMASAVLRVAVGDLSLVLPSSVMPLRSSRKMVTTRRISSRAGVSPGSSRARPRLVTRRWTMSISSAIESGTGKITVLNRRLRALESSLTPRSRLLAVAMMLNPLLP